MARRRDVVIGVVIVASFAFVAVVFGLIMITAVSDGGASSFAGFGNAVGVIPVYGEMSETSCRSIVDQLSRWSEKNSIKAIVLHVNSPGGEAAITQEVYDAILSARDEKPVVVSMAAVAASGGYYIACAADRVVANPGTITGSIGVIMSYHTLGDLFKKVGIGTETVTSGEMKSVGSYSREMTEKEELMLRSVVMDTYEQFVEAVAEGRNMEKDEVYRLADGSIYTGLQAYNLGLVDELGGLEDAVDLAAELAGMDGDPDVVTPYRRERRGLGDLLLSLTGKLSEEINRVETGPRLLFLYR